MRFLLMRGRTIFTKNEGAVIHKNEGVVNQETVFANIVKDEKQEDSSKKDPKAGASKAGNVNALNNVDVKLDPKDAVDVGSCKNESPVKESQSVKEGREGKTGTGGVSSKVAFIGSLRPIGTGFSFGTSPPSFGMSNGFESFWFGWSFGSASTPAFNNTLSSNSGWTFGSASTPAFDSTLTSSLTLYGSGYGLLLVVDSGEFEMPFRRKKREPLVCNCEQQSYRMDSGARRGDAGFSATVQSSSPTRIALSTLTEEQVEVREGGASMETCCAVAPLSFSHGSIPSLLVSSSKYSALPWRRNFDEERDVLISHSGNSFHVYLADSDGPVVFCFHGDGSSGLSFAFAVGLMKDKVRVVAVVLRRHGLSRTALVFMGLSMGGAVAVHAAAKRKLPTLAGLIMVDVAELKPWNTDDHYFKKVKISALALMKLVIQARSGGTLEVMGLMQWKVEPGTIIVMDAFAPSRSMWMQDQALYMQDLLSGAIWSS